MAKFGKFVGLNRKAFDMFEAARFRELFTNVFGDIGSIHCDGYSDVGIGFFTVKLNNCKEKIPNINKKGDFAYNVSKLEFMLTKSEGRIEVGFKTYYGDPFIQYSINCWTNGKYHEYRKQYRNDYNFEGKDHYFYDTKISDFQTDLTTWKWHVFNGIDC